MKTQFTEKRLQELVSIGKIRGYTISEGESIPEGKTGAKTAKFKNRKVEVDGILFDSKKEANRYFELKVLHLAGEISELKLQVVFFLSVCKYIADFTYRDKKGVLVVEDVKSPATRKLPAYRLKKKLMLNELKINIKEY